MNTKENKVGLDALLTPENSVLVLIDHQPFQFANTRNMDPTMILNNTIGLAKAAKAFKVPTILTTVVKDRGGNLPQALQAAFPDQVPIDRTTLNTSPSNFFGTVPWLNGRSLWHNTFDSPSAGASPPMAYAFTFYVLLVNGQACCTGRNAIERIQIDERPVA